VAAHRARPNESMQRSVTRSLKPHPGDGDGADTHELHLAAQAGVDEHHWKTPLPRFQNAKARAAFPENVKAPQITGILNSLPRPIFWQIALEGPERRRGSA
jgi:hypothetical protein